jgi:hypothetical protein
VTTNKFGPSGSSKNTNMVLEKTMEVKPRIIKETFFDIKYISLIIPNPKTDRLACLEFIGRSALSE